MELSYKTVVSVTLIAFAWAGCESASASSRSDGGSLRLASASASESPKEKPSRKTRQEKHRASAAPSASGIDGQSVSLPARIPIVEEELHVGTRQVEGNKMRITINPVETPVKESVRVKREQIVIDREQGGGGEPSLGEQAFQPRTIELVEMAEVPTAGIQPVITNLITIRKEEQVRSQTVQDKLRGTKAEVSREPQQMASSDLPAPAGMAQESAAARASEPLSLPSSQSMSFPVTVAEVRQSLVIDKREVPAEKVRISIQPTERPAEQTVQLREERIVIERTPISETINRLPRDIFSPQSVDITLMKEEPVVSKQPKVKEWLTVRKNVGEQERTVEAKLKETNVALIAPEESR
ncbi:YsnF/AvaK domain-containing protein [Nitrospira moscoviensis]|uniref:DUF2382 domain-containing protein n=1 Tax=Nitrospira moscoviensis TaxID=42253 RepID=A0A0K2GE58_NITMO|nr:YsnF/AvaK domain-containing protein [Nitrospira moscoviensis]ALA59144.1 exported protein of unknown function [Nitrospira moscoviensis]